MPIYIIFSMTPFPSKESSSFHCSRKAMETVCSPVAGPLLGELLKQSNADETPFHSFVLSFSNLNYNLGKVTCPPCSFGMDQNTKILLDDISGEARNGEILAILGPSGSGKSTLIDALADRIDKGSLEGSIKLNGDALESDLMKMISAYVMQDDLLYPMLTVEETLMFAADFKLPSSFSKRQKKARVQSLLDQLGLRNTAATVIGDAGHRGVSGGERRRVSIGIDIMHDPIILFLDEPTSGLDSTNAFMVVKVLKRIAESGSMVIMSIHQPGYRIDSLFDKVLFLSQGQTVYSGPPTSLPKFLDDFGYPISMNENRIEFTLDMIHELELNKSPDGSGTRSLVEFNKYWQSTQQYKNQNFDPLQQFLKNKFVSGSKNTRSALSEILILSKRSMLNGKRMPEVIGTRIGAALFTAFILATVYRKLDNSPKGVHEMFAFLSFAISTAFNICTVAFPMFIQERYILMRELAGNTYRQSSYVISHTISSLLSLVFISLAFTITIFWVVGLSGGMRGYLFFLTVIFTSLWAGTSFLTFLSGVIPNVMAGYTLVINSIGFCFFFSGFIINANRIPTYMRWLNYLSLVKYPYEAMLMWEFHDPNKCFGRGVNIFDNTLLGSLADATKNKLLKMFSDVYGKNITDTGCIVVGPQILKQNGITHLSMWDCLWITVAWGFLYRILFYFTLLYRTSNNKRM